jgi:hypothetical protein
MNTHTVASPTTSGTLRDTGDGSDPSQRLLAEVAQLRAGTGGRDKLLLRLGVVLMVAGPVLGALGYAQSSQTSSAFNQNDAIIVAIVGMTLAIVGVGLFLRYSIGEFLRFWMARLLAEQQRPAPALRPEPLRQEHL